MLGDKLIIEPHHTERAAELCAIASKRIRNRFVISIAGESGAGKSELACETARLLGESGIAAGILQQDDYFVFPPNTNFNMRRRNLEQVGIGEVKLDFLDSNLRSFKRNETPIYKPLVIFNEDRITTEEMDTGNLAVLIVEGTYTSLLKFVDLRIFIELDYRQTVEARRQRGRDKLGHFIMDVLEREHQIIVQHKELADVVIPAAFNRIHLRSA